MRQWIIVVLLFLFMMALAVVAVPVSQWCSNCNPAGTPFPRLEPWILGG